MLLSFDWIYPKPGTAAPPTASRQGRCTAAHGCSYCSNVACAVLTGALQAAAERLCTHTLLEMQAPCQRVQRLL